MLGCVIVEHSVTPLTVDVGSVVHFFLFVGRNV